MQLVENYKQLLTEYHDLLLDAERHEEIEFLPPFFLPQDRIVYIEGHCPLSRESGNSMQLLTRPGERDEGLKELREFTREAESLIIVDPYFFSGKKELADKICDEFTKCSRANGKHLKNVHIVHNKNNETKTIQKKIQKTLTNFNVKFSEKSTTEIHDRVWIKDRKEGLVVGTSLGGIGNRAGFLLPLPKVDLTAILKYLDKSALSSSRS